MRLLEFKATTENLDSILARLCSMIMSGQERNPDEYGMVAAAVVDPAGHQVCRLNRKLGDQRKHAERCAIEAYEAQYGSIHPDSIVVTTLSPCNRPMAERYGEDCEELIRSKGLKRVYCGYQDPSQDTNGYKCTNNEKIKALCKRFADTFLEKEPVKESDDKEPMLKDFIELAVKELGLETVPNIEIVDTVPGAGGTTFGRYAPEDETIYVVARGRHPRDVIRTLGHELVHYKQDVEHRLKVHSGETGSAEENEANAMAGVLMRKYNEFNPMNEDFTQRAKPGSRPGSLRRKAGKKKGEKIGHADIMRLSGRANSMKKSKNAATRKRGIQLARQVNWYRNFHKKKSEAVGFE